MPARQLARRGDARVRWLARWWPALLWAVIIGGFSTSGFSSDSTARYIIPALHWLLPFASQRTLLRIHHVIRKGAHVGEYFILSLLIVRSIRSGRREMHLAWAAVTIAIVAAYATLDEWHQGFAPGRDVEVSDILLDTSAAVLAQGFLLLVAWVAGRLAQRPEENETASAK